MELVLDVNKSVEQNAGEYFEKAKKFKRKIPGIIRTLETQRKKYDAQEISIKESRDKASKTERKWFEKYRWFISSDGFLIIGGRDATTNEIIIKKHTEPGDIVFHTELAGSPFVVIKNPEKKEIPEMTINEAAELCATYSKSWNSGRSTAEVYYILPEQVTKETPTGTAGLAKGSFMIVGNRKYINAKINLALCVHEGKIIGGPISAISKIASTEGKDALKSWIEIIQGNDKTSDVAKSIKRKIGGDLDEIIRTLPPGCKIRKR